VDAGRKTFGRRGADDFCKGSGSWIDYLSVNPKSEQEALFQQLLDTHAAALRRLCSAYRRERADQQDLFQDIAVALWTALPRFRKDASERTWLYRIAHNVALTDSARWHRKRGREVPFDIDPPVVLAEDDRRGDLLFAVRRLEPVERELALLYLEGLTAREIGEVLGIAEGNAAVRLTRLRQRLTQILNPALNKTEAGV
jgi:RNA polymerase sigma factor (sigma-70 family)